MTTAWTKSPMRCLLAFCLIFAQTAQAYTPPWFPPSNLTADKNINDQVSHNSSSSSGAGVGITLGSGGGSLGITANASMARGNIDGTDTTYTNTLVTAGRALNVKSGKDTNLIGATVKGKQIIADVGGDLNIQSLQDTSTYASKQQSASGSATVGASSSYHSFLLYSQTRHFILGGRHFMRCRGNATADESLVQTFALMRNGLHFHIPSHLDAFCASTQLALGSVETIVQAATTLSYYTKFRSPDVAASVS